MKTNKMNAGFKRPMTALILALSLLAACKKDSDSSAPDNGSTLYSIKETKASTGQYTYELVSIDPATATVSTILDMSTLPDNFTIGHLHYLPATNEIVGLDYSRTRLMKINVATKKTSAITIDRGQNQELDWLEVDKAGNMYTVGMHYTGFHYEWTLMQIDPATGNTSPLANFTNSLQGFQYIPATNELAGINDISLQKYNITTKDTSSVLVATSTPGHYENMGVDNNSNLYAFKVLKGTADKSQIVKLDAATGAETVITNLNESEPIYDLLFLSKSSELIGIWESTSLYKYNLGTNTTSLLPLTSDPNVSFSDPASN